MTQLVELKEKLERAIDAADAKYDVALDAMEHFTNLMHSIAKETHAHDIRKAKAAYKQGVKTLTASTAPEGGK